MDECNMDVRHRYKIGSRTKKISEHSVLDNLPLVFLWTSISCMATFPLHATQLAPWEGALQLP